MTQISIRSPEQSSPLSGAIAGFFTAAVIVLAGVLSLAPYLVQITG
jgi:hypothetical protein